MATILLQAAGAALGGIFGPVGAVVGRAAGALAGSAVDQSLLGGNRTVRGRRLESGRIPSSEEGVGINRVYGTTRVAGNLIWATRFEEMVTSERQGGKGGTRVENVSYFANFAIGLCEGPIAGVRRIWADGREIDQTAFTIRVHTGELNQLCDPLIEARQGAGNTPAYGGLAYAVFERMPIERFGNRIPLLQFEVIRPIGELESALKAITIIPGATEHGYADAVVTETTAPGASRMLNRNVLFAGSDWRGAIDELQAICPNLTHVALVAAWFGSDLRTGHCVFQPGVEVSERLDETAPWRVSGIERPEAYVVSQKDGAPAYGGTPSDASVLDAISDLKARGLKVYLYPFVLMDVAESNGLPDPYGGTQQAVYPWRGRITCHPAAGQAGSSDGTAAARSDIATMCGPALAGDFAAAGSTVTYAGSDFGYRRLVLHYAWLAHMAGGVDGFIIGSEMRGATRVRDGEDRFPFVEQLTDLAAQVRTVLGASCAITYAADWTEYFGYQPSDGSGDVFFNLDPLWASPAIDAIGIDNYMPLADWHDNDLALGNPDGFETPTDREAMKRQIAGGEGYDWFYASFADRKARRRTPITDGAYGKPWVFRVKDLEGWWRNVHVERRGGVELGAPTAWVPQSKPFWFTELGCPAVDKGANQPNVFPDPKSSESAFPYFSLGGKSDLVQRRFLEAHLQYWNSAEAPDGMVSRDHIFAWTWDARPYPAFPANLSLWNDGDNWQTGHWLNGRLGAASAPDLLAAILADHGVFDVDVSGVAGDIQGYVQADPVSARQMLEPLIELLQVDAVASGDRLVLRSRSRTRRVAVPHVLDVLADPEDGARVETVRAQEAERASEALLDHYDVQMDHESATARSRRLSAGNNRLARLSLPVAMNEPSARQEADLWLRDHWAGGTAVRFFLPPQAVALEPGDVVRLLEGPERPFLVTRIDDGAVRAVEARAFALAGGAGDNLPARSSNDQGSASIAWAPIVRLLDLPLLRGSDPTAWSVGAGYSQPWRRMTLSSSPGLQDFTRRVTLDQPAKLGVLMQPLPPGVSGRFDRSSSLTCRLFAGGLSSRDRLSVLNGANIIAVRSVAGPWEVVQFEQADEIEAGIWRLSNLLRGQSGSDDAMAAGAPAGADIVVIDAAIRALGLTHDEAGLATNWRVSNGTDVVAVAPAGEGMFGLRAHMPLSPVHLRAKPQPDGSVRLSWVRRGRIDADNWLGGEIPLDAEVERYRVDILADDGAQLRMIDGIGEPWLTYAADDVLADFGALPERLSFRVRQHGRVVALGVAATATVAL
jgi:hypothetical protein